MNALHAPRAAYRMPLVVMPPLDAWATSTGWRRVHTLHCRVPIDWRGGPVAIAAAATVPDLDAMHVHLAEQEMARALGMHVRPPLLGELVEQRGRVVAVGHVTGELHWTELTGAAQDVWAGTGWVWSFVEIRPLRRPLKLAGAVAGLGYLDAMASTAVALQTWGV